MSNTIHYNQWLGWWGENVTGRGGLNDLKFPLAGGNVHTTGGLCK